MNSRNTDLEQVKLVAHALLEVEIQPTEFSPIHACFSGRKESKVIVDLDRLEKIMEV